MSLLASPRNRRRLGWLSMLLAILAGITGLVMLLPGRHQKLDKPVPGGSAVPIQEVPYNRTEKDLRKPLAVAARFVDTAVTRKDVAASWDLIDPDFPGKSEYTRKQWVRRGDIPVVPFPAVAARWRPDYSYQNEIGLKVALYPPAHSESRAAVFDIALHASGTGRHRQWRVVSFMPAGGQAGPGNGPPGRAGGFPDLGNRIGQQTSSHLSRAWLLLPLSVFGLALLTPLGLGIANSVRVRRAERQFARSSL